MLKKRWNTSDLPKCSKTLLKTPKEKIETISMSNGGEYWHFGLRNIFDTLSSCGYNLPAEIKLNINIDGIPIECGGGQFWPILCSIEDSSFSPMAIGIYHGKKKPGGVGNYASTDEFLGTFIDECVSLYLDGYSYGTNRSEVKVHNFINDIPASALVKKIKGHTGYSSCHRCDVVGETQDNGSASAVYFTKFGNRRTDHSFRNQLQPEHHNGESTITRLIYLDMIKDFPIDYMHLICLGVVKKLLVFWTVCPTSNKNGKLSAFQISSINQELADMTRYFPSEFNRKHLDFTKVSSWKATQFRSFLLYVGVVVLKGNINEEIYNHFLLLHFATTICLSNKNFRFINVAEEMYLDFINQFADIYGKQYVSQNVHNLGHIVDDVRKFGALDNFSAFKFENKLGVLKRLLRSGHLPLQQVAKRTYEKFLLDIKAQLQSKTISPVNSIEKDCFKFEDFIIKNNNSDRWFLTKSKDIVAFKCVVNNAGKIILQGQKLSNKTNFYVIPSQSR